MTARPTSADAVPDGLALGFDVTAWYQDPAFAPHLSRRHWRRLPARLAEGVGQALAACRRHGSRATFFVSGEVAEGSPDLVRAIAAAGHEVGLAGPEPCDLAGLAAADRAVWLDRCERTRRRLEALAGAAVRGFRAPWPVAAGGAWWRAAMAGPGCRYDATEVADGSAPPGQLVVAAHGIAGPGAARCVPTWALDAGQPRLVGLPRAVLRGHRKVIAAVGGGLERLLATGSPRPFAAALGLPAALPAAPDPPPAPPPAPLPAATAPPPAPRPDLPELAVVVPLKDEEPGLPSLAVELDALAARLTPLVRTGFVLVDDGSTDRTWPMLQELFGSRSDVRLVRHERNLGVAAAIRTGLGATAAPLAASIDGDLSYDPAELEHMLPLLEGADVVTASPYHARGGVRHVPPWRLLLSRALSRCYRWLLRSDVRTWTSCFRLYRRAAVADLPLEHPGFLGTAEWLVRVLRRGGVVREHPCVLEARLFGVSKMKVLRTICGHLRLLWQVLRGRIS
ncbi:MAG: glycosyltransferase [Planctomycetes bacterium]|nr:glycosyltransferase [Planctomycetota bacterium]